MIWYLMFGHVMLCYVMFCYVMICNVIVCYVMLFWLLGSLILVEGVGSGLSGIIGGPGDLAAAVCRVGGSGSLFIKYNNPNLSGGEQ